MVSSDDVSGPILALTSIDYVDTRDSKSGLVAHASDDTDTCLRHLPTTCASAHFTTYLQRRHGLDLSVAKATIDAAVARGDKAPDRGGGSP